MARNGVRFLVLFLLTTVVILWYISVTIFHANEYTRAKVKQSNWMVFWSSERKSTQDLKNDKAKEKNLPRPPDLSFLNKTWRRNEYRMNEIKRYLGRFMDARRSLSITKSGVTVGNDFLLDFSPQNSSVVVTKEMYDLLPDESPLRDRNVRSCALVGNGGILLNSSCGGDIDKADFVIRCNFASLSGYERDVGSKTNMFSFNPSVLRLKYNLLRNESDRTNFYRDLDSLRPKVLLWIPAFEYGVNRGLTDPILHFVTEHRQNLSHVQLLFPHSVVQIFKGYWRSQGVQEPRLSTGLIMYTIALQLCQHITLYGFYPFATDLDDRPIPYHYDQPPNATFNPGKMHNFPMEFAYLRKMHEQGVSKLRIGKCR